MDENYEHNVAWVAEGWRTAAATCLRCGVSLILSRTVDVLSVHDAWHERLGQ